MEYPQTRTETERHAVASACAAGLKLQIPILLDSMDDAAERTYNGWPERLYVLSEDGKVVYKGGKGPYGFAPDELYEFLTDRFRG